MDFIEKFFDEENISYELQKDYYNDETRVIAKNYNMPLKEDTNTLLDKCILLNTYLKCYFKPKGYLDFYDIRYRVDYYEKKETMYLKSQSIDPLKSEDVGWRPLFEYGSPCNDTIYINNMVVDNTNARDKVEMSNDHGWVEYNYVYSELSENLKRR